jgi:ubiquinone/menaquinone biosynthesis C-methylase UbiE
MKPRDSKRIVAAGYDRIAERYASWAAGIHDAARERATHLLLDALPPGAAVLELGCGNGLPTAKRLAERFLVTGVDISARQVALARRHVPSAVFQQADMAALAFPPAETNRRLVEATGLALRSASVETLDEHGNPVSFLWVIAQKSSLADPC